MSRQLDHRDARKQKACAGKPPGGDRSAGEAEPVESETRDARVPPRGQRVVLPLPFGTARCDDGEAALDEEPAALVADVDGEQLRVPLQERPGDLLAELRDTECAAAAALADVELRLGDTWERTGPRTLTGEIELTQRQPGTTADVHEVESNVIFTVSTEAASTGRLAVSDDRPAARGPIAITASRCDPHAREPARVDIVAEGGARRALEDLLTSCLG